MKSGRYESKHVAFIILLKPSFHNKKLGVNAIKYEFKASIKKVIRAWIY